MLIEEAIQSIQSLYSKGVQSKDSRLAVRQIYSTLLDIRSDVLRQQVDKRQTINEDCYQLLPCVELEKADASDCPYVISGCMILKSKYRLPKIISSMNKPIIQYVTNITGNIRFDKTTFENVKYASGDKFTGSKPKYFFKDGYLFVTNRELLKSVTPNILAEDPIEAAKFKSLCADCPDCDCKSYLEYDLHLDRRTFNMVEKLTVEKLIVLFGQMKEDKYANTTDDDDNKGQMIHR